MPLPPFRRSLAPPRGALRAGVLGARPASALLGLGAGRRAGGEGPRAVRALSQAAEYEYDLISIGAGSGGVRASRMSTAHGAGKVAVVELPFAPKASDTTGGVGGTCVIRGCVPKKLLVYGSEYAKHFKDSAGYGWEERARPAHDWQALIAKKNGELNRLVGAYGNTLGNAGVEVLEGRGKIVDAHTVEVAGKQYSAKYILVATGGLPFVPDIPGKEHVITSDDALELPALPKKIAIVGGGYIAVEFAGIFNSFGAEVHLYYRQPMPLRGFDEEAREFLTAAYAESGIHLHPLESPTAVEKLGEGEFKLVTDKSEDTFDQVMFATGRKPNVEGLGLENAGVETKPNGVIVVDEFSKTNVDSIYAIGDVTDRMNLTPVALMEGMALASTLFKGEPKKPDYDYIASAVFSQPPLATVGLTEEQAKEEYGDIDVYTSNFRPMKNTISGSTDRTWMKLIVDAKTDKVVGVHIAGADGAEMMQGVAVAVKMGATKADFDASVGIHPTSAEEFVTMRSVTRQVRATETVTA